MTRAPSTTRSDDRRAPAWLLAGLTAVWAGLAEAHLYLGFGPGPTLAGDAAAVLGIVGLYLVFGAAVGLVLDALVLTRLAPRERRRAEPGAVAAALSALFLAAVALRIVPHGTGASAWIAGWAAAVALSGAACFVLREGLRGLPWLARAGVAWAAAAVLLAAALARLALAGPAGAATIAGWIAVAVAAVAFGTALLPGARRAGLRAAGGAAALLAGVGAFVAWPPHAAPPAPASPGPSVLLVSIDTLRADRVGAYGHAAARTPILDGLAERGALFESAVAPAILTGPSHVSILTGARPGTHGVTENLMPIPPDTVTLAETLREHGWHAAAFVSGRPVTERALGVLSRFDEWDDDLRAFRLVPPQAFHATLVHWVGERLKDGERTLTRHDRPAAETADAAIAWLHDRARAPFFVWTHFFDPHLPYEAPEEFESDEARAYDGPASGDWYDLTGWEQNEILADPAAVEHMRALYDAEIAYTDRHLGRLIEAAQRRAGPAGVWIVVTADHGEPMGEHGLYWWRELYEPSVHVPLLVVPPETPGGWAGGAAAGLRVAEPVRLTDVAPTLLDVLGLPPFEGADGMSLRPHLERGVTASEPAVSAKYVSTGDPFALPVYAVRWGDWKLVWKLPGRSENRWVERESFELYDLASDPGELRDLSQQEPERVIALKTLLEVHVRAAAGPGLELTPEEEAALRALGYLR